MKKAYALCILFFLLTSSVWAQYKNVGLAPYAMLSEHWPCKLQQESTQSSEAYSFAVVWNTFGTSTSCLEQYLESGKLRALEIHLVNEVCQRNNNCGPYEFLYKIPVQTYNRKLKAKKPAFLAKVKKYFMSAADFVARKVPESVTCYISVGLESNLTKEAAQVLVQIAEPLFPACKVVWNPNGANPHATPMKGTVFELHHSNEPLPAPCIANLDGEDISFPSRPALISPSIDASKLPVIAKRFESCDENFLWIAEYNGLAPGKFVDPRQRTSSRFPSRATFDLVEAAKEKLN